MIFFSALYDEHPDLSQVLWKWFWRRKTSGDGPEVWGPKGHGKEREWVQSSQ